MEGKRLVLVEDDGGGMTAFVGRGRDGLRDLVGHYRPLACSAQLLLLRRGDTEGGGEAAEPPARILMAGEVVQPNTVLDVVSVAAASRWTGTLHVYAADTHRVLGIDRGALRFARSDDPEDRLNKVLFRLGVLSPTQSEEVERGPKSDQRFGEGLVHKGMMDERELFGYLERQMAEIFFSAVLAGDGCYVFTVGDREAGAASVTAFLPLQQLLFDAAERLDRFQEHRKLIPDEALCPAMVEGVEATRLPSAARRVLGLCDGRRSVREIAGESWLGRLETLAVVDELLRQGAIELRRPKPGPGDVARRLAARFDAALGEIRGAVEATGDFPHLRSEVLRWAEVGPFQSTLRLAVTPELTVDAERLGEVLSGLAVRDAEEELRQALHELVSFALFTASLSLPRERERALARAVEARLS